MTGGSSIPVKLAFSISFAFSFSLTLGASAPHSLTPFPKISSFLSLKAASSSSSRTAAAHLLALLGSAHDARKVPASEASELRSCLRFLVPFSSSTPVKENKHLRLRHDADDMVWWPPEPVMELARLAVDSGGDPSVIQMALDPTPLPVPDVEGLKKDKCQLTRTRYGYRFADMELNTYFAFLFELIAERGPSVGLNVSLSRYDLFHGHLFVATDSGRLGMLFHAKEYPAYEKESFPYNMGYCQRGSNVVYDDSMNLRNILWLAPLPNDITEAWLAPGVLVVLDAHPEGIIYKELVPEYVDIVRTIYEDDFGDHVADVNYLNDVNLPLSLLKTAQGHPMLVELKNGETYNGHLVNCDTWMNIHLREVICTSKDGDRFWRMPECYIRGNTIKYLRVPDEVIDKVQEETTKSRTDRKPPGVGRGRGRAREDNSGRPAKGIGRGLDDGGGRGGGGRGRGGAGGKGGGARGKAFTSVVHVSQQNVPLYGFPSCSKSLLSTSMGSELTYRGREALPADGAGAHSPKPEKRFLCLPRPLRYLLNEQRLLFVLVGVALASVFFVFAPYTAPSTAGAHLAVDLARLSSMPAVHGRYRMALERRFIRERLPLGLKRKGLRIVVAGGAGFVGSHLVDRLIERGDSVIAVDNFFTGRKENVMHHFGNPNFELIRHDVVEPLLLAVDQIYHLACPASPVHYNFNPVKTIISFC
ncbi:hypothetical protein MUK42_27258 [Musa troglodytarum]|uniref:Sm domain-containing protein n=1 Tax=Musa troglodytarum TaxID=320322 RepID=A0A9E7JRF1_9LILI|nr:hypothetical protein MUK42_27258 [Musa troglodytarum]